MLAEIHLPLTPNREHGKVFEKVPIILFRRSKSLKDILVKAKVLPYEKKKSWCRSCECTRCEICKHFVTTKIFRFFSIKSEYCIKPNNLKYRSSNVVYLFLCKACSRQYTDSTESFRSRFNYYKSAHSSFIKRNTVKQCHFTLFLRMTTSRFKWEITLHDQTDGVDNLSRKESFWQCELGTYQPNGLNKRNVAVFDVFFLK